MPEAGSCFAEWAVALRDLLECGYQFDERAKGPRSGFSGTVGRILAVNRLVMAQTASFRWWFEVFNAAKSFDTRYWYTTGRSFETFEVTR